MLLIRIVQLAGVVDRTNVPQFRPGGRLRLDFSLVRAGGGSAKLLQLVGGCVNLGEVIERLASRLEFGD